MLEKWRILWLCVFIFSLNGLLNGGVEWIKTATPDDTKLVLLGFIFITAAGLAGAAFGLERKSGDTFRVVTNKVEVRLLLFLLVLTSVIGLPSTFFASESVLGSSKNQFIDFSMTPVFALIAGYLFENRVSSTSRYLLWGVFGCALGSIFILLSLSDPATDSVLWPENWTRGESLTLGIVCAIMSSVSGALTLLFVRKVSQYVSSSFILFGVVYRTNAIIVRGILIP
jgi:drug/metabolite transporter (DMT)-like permease